MLCSKGSQRLEPIDMSVQIVFAVFKKLSGNEVLIRHMLWTDVRTGIAIDVKHVMSIHEVIMDRSLRHGQSFVHVRFLVHLRKLSVVLLKCRPSVLCLPESCREASERPLQALCMGNDRQIRNAQAAPSQQKGMTLQGV